MTTQPLDIKSHSTSTGRLYFKGNEFFKSKKIKAMLEQLRKSSIYLKIKEDEAKKTISEDPQD